MRWGGNRGVKSTGECQEFERERDGRIERVLGEEWLKVTLCPWVLDTLGNLVLHSLRLICSCLPGDNLPEVRDLSTFGQIFSLWWPSHSQALKDSTLDLKCTPTEPLWPVICALIQEGKKRLAPNARQREFLKQTSTCLLEDSRPISPLHSPLLASFSASSILLGPAPCAHLMAGNCSACNARESGLISWRGGSLMGFLELRWHLGYILELWRGWPF